MAGSDKLFFNLRLYLVYREFSGLWEHSDACREATHESQYKDADFVRDPHCWGFGCTACFLDKEEK